MIEELQPWVGPAEIAAYLGCKTTEVRELMVSHGYEPVELAAADFWQREHVAEVRVQREAAA